MDPEGPSFTNRSEVVQGLLLRRYPGGAITDEKLKIRQNSGQTRSLKTANIRLATASEGKREALEVSPSLWITPSQHRDD